MVTCAVYTRAKPVKLYKMVLFKYLRPIAENGLDPQDSLSQTVPRVVIEKVNKELHKAEEKTKKRRSYLFFFTAEEKAQVAKYGSTSPVCAAVERISKE